ncbi:VanZ family protein [Geodermatophilus sp. YIM 151500]|uniref:VanZ family protein n=1 Tax=Geodermatophilus sp. YIM 151500 TaxID=2984531 RepID=UPI0021E4DBF3|nr:VanZ family protein [Geodermatophilus sp. YIM 151500]MCV2490067.1 VanZ family protein [Geodermatophilus sp. YIM 151500]
MDDGARPAPALDGLLASALVGVASLTLTPAGASGWAWGAPLAELRWYATGLDSPTTVLQLLGNLLLLVPPAVLAVLRRPALAAPGRLGALSVGVAAGIELLQWALPLGRVVSPLDAALNASGAVVAGLVAARLHAAVRPRCTA